MILLSRRSMLALAAVADIAIHARPLPVAAKALSARLNLPPRHLETLLQALVRTNILKGVRGPRGGYELARERRRISAGDVIRAIMSENGGEEAPVTECAFVQSVIGPIIDKAGQTFLSELDEVSIDDICQKAGEKKIFTDQGYKPDFII
jgi:Rrf2 family transcriptional regulator, iron-sulfur cluster assembly transcription factor